MFWKSAPGNKSGWHVGIVESVSGKTVNTIEGNVTGDVVARRKQNISGIKYVARPKSCN